MRTRKSTSGGCVVLGKHLIKSWSSTQTSISLSSGDEAEKTQRGMYTFAFRQSACGQTIPEINTINSSNLNLRMRYSSDLFDSGES